MNRRVRGEELFALVIIVAGLVLAWQIPSIPGEAGYAGIGPRFFPGLVVSGLIVCGGALLLRRPRRDAPDAIVAAGDAELADDDGPPPADWSRFALASGSLLAHMALIGLVGFTVAGALLCFGICRALDTRRPWRDLALSWLLAWGLFHLFRALGLNLPALLPGGLL